MAFLIWFFSILIVTAVLFYHRISVHKSSIVLGISIVGSWLFGLVGFLGCIFALAIFGGVAFMLHSKPLRQEYFTQKIYKVLKKGLPKISATEKEALEAGSIWWDGELFSGNPNWHKLLKYPKPQLTNEEKAFINGPVETLCKMVNEWEIINKKDLPKEAWDFIKKNKFFGLIIPKQYGGLEFSALAHSEILAKLAGTSTTVASTVAVPNSLGPAELIMHYGTHSQKEYYLPKLAIGEEIPCFGLTGTTAGSDATSIPDTGVVCYQEFENEKQLGILLNFNKRYITLAPIATVIGIAFKLYDPDNILNGQKDLGITCALVPRNTKGVKIGNRHMPLMTPFQNGPIIGENVFIPMDWIIGGQEQIGKGWKMLVECLSCGRGISLPSTASGKIKVGLAATSAYARIRRQFKQPIGFFEGIEEPLAQIVANSFISEAGRKITAVSIDNGEKPAILGAIVKYDITGRAQRSAINAMDIHGGKGIILGPKNYLAESYINSPIAITVEGANILTRSLIVFGQGAVRAHPFITKELAALEIEDEAKSLSELDDTLMKHIGFSVSNAMRSIFFSISKGFLIKKPVSDKSARLYQLTTWASSSFAFMADFCLLTLGGKLKFKEKLSGRLADMLASLYLSSCCLKIYKDSNFTEEEFDILQYSVESLLAEFWYKAQLVIDNMPNIWLKWTLRLTVMPFGAGVKAPSDKLSKKVAKKVLEPNASRDKLIDGAYLSANENNLIGQLEQALKQVIAAEPIEKRIYKAVKEDYLEGDNIFELIKNALKSELITDTEAMIVKQAEELRAEIIAVDEFSPKDFSAIGKKRGNGDQ